MHRQNLYFHGLKGGGKESFSVMVSLWVQKGPQCTSLWSPFSSQDTHKGNWYSRAQSLKQDLFIIQALSHNYEFHWCWGGSERSHDCQTDW